ncbi:MAG TPA: efflux RND transporter periplasmic adaptor subunit [Candidatus Saccharimonadales bacterium]|jgi:RND family efflux transporter MFP subunit|nr:efflux RND transporter periplasmic adaptor subunit [Candidatus Saccharimonadales bacterium]
MEVVSKLSEQAKSPTNVHAKSFAASSQGSALTRIVTFLLIVIVVAVVVIWGISSRRAANAQLSVETRELAIPTVAVIHPKLGAPQQEIVIPGDMQPFADAGIFARTNGYLKKWYADIGTNVKEGQLLAEIDSPEIDQQLEQARADLATAQANFKLAEVTATRYKDLLKTDSVAQQDVDNASGNYDARKTAVESAQANVKRLQQMQSFEKVYAPFAGMITARNTDIGQLIDSGSSGGTARELFHIAAMNPLRVYINVPQYDSPQIKPGLRADLVLTEFPGKRFQGTVVRSSGAIDNTSRTLLTEVDVENSSHLLKPGGYVEVHLKMPSPINTFTIPVNTTIFKSAGLQVATVQDGKKIKLIPVTPGRDFGTDIEIVAGLSGNESVVLNPSDSLSDGTQVQIAETPAPVQRKP